MRRTLLRRTRDDDHDESAPDEGLSNRRTAIIVLTAALPVLIGLYLIALYWSRPETYGEEIRLDEFNTMASAGRIHDAVVLVPDSRVIGESDRGPFWTAFGASETAMNRVLSALEGGNVPTTVRQQWGKGLIMPLTSLLGVLLIVDGFVLVFLLIRGRGDALFGFGKSGARQLQSGESKITFKDVAGLDEAAEELAEIRDYLQAPERFLAMGAAVPKGILLAGPPGCGKTLLARAVAGEAGVPFYSMSGAGFVEMFVGVGAARIRDLFKTAKATAPCIVFIDELDAVGRGRVAGSVIGQDERETTLNQLLVEMDGFEMVSGVVVLAATNRPDVLDHALLRPGRFDRRVTIDRPDVKGRLGILKIHARGKPLSDQADLEVVAKRTPGFSGADLANVVNEAALLAARRGRDEISQPELLEAVERVIAGPERRTRVLSPHDRRIIAYHEAGHAVVSAAAPGADVVHKVSIVSRGHAGGMTWFTPGDELMVAARSQLEDRLMVLLAGRAAEQLLTGEPSSGSQSDIERATVLAKRMVAQLGMGKTLGPMSLAGAAETRGEAGLSPRLASDLDEEVQELLRVALTGALAVLERHQSVWEALAQKLMDDESIEGPDLELMLDGVRSGSRPSRTDSDDIVLG
ncbi:MAG TPA: ATP-dependent zinc metalloprotease FtsH [Nitriliruptorales bacterium]|nr:ATP-dependent zinc metalloprotease FtsH [Nitriliruptorales bacterium]